MRRRKTVPAELSQAERAFVKWRRSRKRGERIPAKLWALAVELAATHGVCRVSSKLRLDYYALRRKLAERHVEIPACEPPAFVELSPASLANPLPPQQSEYLIELEDASGTKMSIRVRGAESLDVMSLSRGLWSSR